MEQIGDMMECSICTEMFTDPRMLPCIHTFCLKCLEETASKSDKYPGDTMPCPLCRQAFTIPPDGVTSLQKNFFMERLIEIAKISKPLKCTVSCDVCLLNKVEADVEVHDALKYCIECRENMCEFCSVQHKRQSFSRNHQIVSFGSQLQDENVLKVKAFVATYCKQHCDDELRMYCSDCKAVICIMCFAECHKLHDCSHVNKVADGFRDDIGVFSLTVVESAKNRSEKILKLMDEERKFMEESEIAEGAINDRAEELKEFIDMHAEVLLDELVQRKATRMKETEQRKGEIERYLTMVSSFNAYCQELISKGTPTDICRSVHDLRARADELIEVNAMQTTCDTSTSAFQLSFNKSAVEDTMKTENIVGKLEEKNMLLTEKCTKEELTDFTERYLALVDNFNVICREIKSKGTPSDVGHFVHALRAKADELHNVPSMQVEHYSSATHVSFQASSLHVEGFQKAQSVAGDMEGQHKSIAKIKTKEVRVEFTRQLKCPTNAQALTKMDGRIYVLYRKFNSVFESSTLIVICQDRKPFQQYQHIELCEISCVQHVVPSEKLRCLFISDSSARCIWKVTIDDFRATKWLPIFGNPLALFMLSMSTEGNLLLLRDDDGASQMEIYGSDANMIQIISLSCDIVSPLHVVQESNGLFLIIHRSDYSFSGIWVISELNIEGQIIRQLNPREVYQKLWNPYHMFLDSGNNRLFVNLWDALKFRVVICDINSLEWKETILRSDYGYLPLHYDERKKQLIAGRSHHVIVCNIH